MRKSRAGVQVLQGVFAGVLACGFGAGALGFVLASEGIGPGDSLSKPGLGLPVLVGALVVGGIVRRSRARLVGASLFFAVLLAYIWLPELLGGAGRDQDSVPFSLAIGAMLVPVLLAQVLGRSAQGGSD